MQQIELEEEGKERRRKSMWSLKSVRLQVALLLSSAMAIHGLIRGNFGMALICMIRDPVYSASLPDQNLTSNTGSYPVKEHNPQLQVDWGAREISLMHTAFYVGTFIGTFSAESSVRRLGAKLVITIGLLVAALCSWAIPVAVYLLPHYSLPAVLRFVMGITMGLFIPSASTMLAKWFAQEEKSTAMAIFTVGNQFGIGVAMYSTAELCRLNFLAGWPNSFILYGTLGIVFVLLWVPLMANRPRECKRVCTLELMSIDQSGLRRRALSVVTTTPYKKIFLSPVVIALTLCSFCQSFVYVAMISYLPEFFRSVMGMRLSSNGLWSAMPFIVQVVSKMTFGLLADWIKRRGVSADTVAKAFNGIASFGCAACLLIVSLMQASSPLLLFFISFGMVLTSGYVPGYNTSLVCIAPAFTTVISAYCQGYAQVASILAPLIIGSITEVRVIQKSKEDSSIGPWSIVFQIIVAVCVVSGLAFQLFGSATLQSWAHPTAGGSSKRINLGVQKDANTVLVREEKS